MYSDSYLRSMFNPISPGVSDPGNTPGGAQSARIQFKGSLTLKFGECIESYVQLAKIKKKLKILKTTEESNFGKKSEILGIFFSSRKCPPFSQNSIFSAL